MIILRLMFAIFSFKFGFVILLFICIYIFDFVV